MAKQKFKENFADVARKITQVSFVVGNRENIGKESHVHIVACNLFNQDATPAAHGILDKRMVPMHVAKTLPYSERVNPLNIELMRKLVRDGTNVYPAANSVQQVKTQFRIHLKYANRLKTAQQLQCGDTVERHPYTIILV